MNFLVLFWEGIFSFLSSMHWRYLRKKIMFYGKYRKFNLIYCSKEKAKDAIFYSYKRHINGFAAILEDHQVEEIQSMYIIPFHLSLCGTYVFIVFFRWIYISDCQLLWFLVIFLSSFQIYNFHFKSLEDSMSKFNHI